MERERGGLEKKNRRNKKAGMRKVGNFVAYLDLVAQENQRQSEYVKARKESLELYKSKYAAVQWPGNVSGAIRGAESPATAVATAAERLPIQDG